MSPSYSTLEDFLNWEDDAAPVATPPPYTHYSYTRKLPSTTGGAPVPYNQAATPQGLFARSAEGSSPLTSNGVLFLGMYRDEGEDYLDFAGRAAYYMPSPPSSSTNGETSARRDSVDVHNEANHGENEEAADYEDMEEIEEDIATVHHIRREVVERLEEIYARLFLQNQDRDQQQMKTITKLVLRDPHFQDEEDVTGSGLTSSIATEPVLAALLSRVASASSSPSEQSSSQNTNGTDIRISSIRLEDLSLPLLHSMYPEIHCPLTLLVQSPLLRELVLFNVVLEPKSNSGSGLSMFKCLEGLVKLELRDVEFEVETTRSDEVGVAREEVEGERGRSGVRGRKTYLESFLFKNSSDVVERLINASSSEHCLAFSKLKEVGLDFGSKTATELSRKLLEPCREDVESLRVCFEPSSYDEECENDATTASEQGNFPALFEFSKLRYLELSSTYELASLTPYSQILTFLDSRGPLPVGVDMKLVLRGVPIVPPFSSVALDMANTTSLPSSPPDLSASCRATSLQTKVEAMKLVHSVLVQTFSSLDATLCSSLPIDSTSKTKVRIQAAFDTSIGVDTFIRARQLVLGKTHMVMPEETQSGEKASENVMLLQLHEDLQAHFNPPEDESEVDGDEETLEAGMEIQEKKLRNLTRAFKALYLPHLSSKHQEVGVYMELVDVYDLDEDMDQRTVEEADGDVVRSSSSRNNYGSVSDSDSSLSDDDETSAKHPGCISTDSDSTDSDDEMEDGDTDPLVWTSPDGATTVSRSGSMWLVNDPSLRFYGCHAGRVSS